MDKILFPDARLPEGDIHGRYIWDAIRLGLWPFRAYRIEVYFQRSYDFNAYRVVAEAIFRDGYRLAHTVLVDINDLDADPEREAVKTAKKMFEAFRSREDHLRYLMTPNVELGEN